jgi:hypothetical protein
VEQLREFKKSGKQDFSALSNSTLDSTESSPETGRKVIIFTERSLGSDRYVFLENARKCGLVSELEYQMYIQFYEWLVGQKMNELKLKGVIYLGTNVEECFKVNYILIIRKAVDQAAENRGVGNNKTRISATIGRSAQRVAFLKDEQ